MRLNPNYHFNQEKKQSYFGLSYNFISDHRVIDYSDKRNEGVMSDRMVETSEGFEIRQIIYINLADGV